MQATDEELDIELVWGRRRAKLTKGPAVQERSHGDFHRCSLNLEKERLKEYIAEHSVDDCVCNLTQHPGHVRAASQSDVLHTFACNCIVV